MKAIVQHFTGTTEEWKAANPKLYDAVWGFEKTRDGKVLAKLGNGVDYWNNLKYFDIENIHGLPEQLADTLANAKKYTDVKVADEAQVREDADNALREALEAEAQARAQGDIDTLANAKEYTDERLDVLLQTTQGLKSNHAQYYPGCLYEQFPGGYTPAELIDKGVFPEDSQWDVWSHRAELYELVPAADYPSAALTAYASGQNVAANAYRIYQRAGDDRQIWKANKAISSTPGQINPLDWALLPGIVRVRRCDLHSDIWTDNDLEIGDEVTYNGTDYRVSGILVLGGKYLAGEGGNRPTFINGGTGRDRIRNIASMLWFYLGSDIGIYPSYNEGQCLYILDDGESRCAGNSFQEDSYSGRYLRIDVSRVVPTGAENSPRTLAKRYWRRVS